MNVQVELLHYSLFGVVSGIIVGSSVGVDDNGVYVSTIIKVYDRIFYVMSKALSDELSFTLTGLVLF